MKRRNPSFDSDAPVNLLREPGPGPDQVVGSVSGPDGAVDFAALEWLRHDLVYR